MGFECIAIALILHDRRICRRASYRHCFRHGNTASIEQLRQEVVLRGLRRRPPPPIHTNENLIPTHAYWVENLRKPRKQSARCSNSTRYVAGSGASKPHENSADPRREIHLGLSLRLKQPRFQKNDCIVGLDEAHHKRKSDRQVEAQPSAYRRTPTFSRYGFPRRIVALIFNSPRNPTIQRRRGNQGGWRTERDPGAGRHPDPTTTTPRSGVCESQRPSVSSNDSGSSSPYRLSDSDPHQPGAAPSPSSSLP